MRFSRTQALTAADKFVKLGKLQEAVSQYKKLAEDNPRDMNAINKLGDLLLRLGKTKEALRHFLQIAEFYAKDGFFLKAIAMYKKIVKIDPANTESLVRLAGLHQQQGLTIESKALYLQLADQMIKRGDFAGAVDVLPKVLEIEPANVKIRRTYAEVLVRAGNREAAVREFGQIAEALFAAGNPAEATQFIRRMSQAASGPSEVAQIMLTLVRESERPAPEIVTAVEEIAHKGDAQALPLALLVEVYRRVGEPAKAEAALDQLLRLPGIEETDQPDVPAIVGRSLLAMGRTDESCEWFSRGADRFLQSSQPAEACRLLDEFLQAAPDHRTALTGRAEVAARLEDVEGEIAVLQRLAPILARDGEPERAREAVERLLALRPEEQRFQVMMGQLREGTLGGAGVTPAGSATGGDQEAGPPAFTGDLLTLGAEVSDPDGGTVQMSVEDSDPYQSEDLTIEDGEEGEPPAPALNIEAIERSEAADEEFIGEHLTEAEVFMKYGLLEKAKQQLQLILEKHPRHVASRVKLKQIYSTEGNRDKVVETCLALAEIKQAKGLEEQARDLVNEAVRVDAGHPLIAKYRASLSAAEPPTSPAGAGQPREPKGDANESPMARKEAAEEPDIEIEFDMAEEGETSTVSEPLPERVEEETPDDLLIEQPTGGDGGSLGSETAGSAQDGVGWAGTGVAAAAHRDPGSDKLGEVDFYIDQGLLDEAHQVLFQLRKQYPESDEVARRIKKLGGGEVKKPPERSDTTAEESTGVDLEVERVFGGERIEPAPPAPQRRKPHPLQAKPVFRMETPDPESGGEFFDLAAELGKSLEEAQEASDSKERDSLEGPGHSIEDIFKAFKKGVEQQVESTDFDTHYNLGIAYKEMGLVDEAIGEFQYAAKDPARTIECCGILGLCFRDKGMPDLALKWYKKGLDSPELDESTSVGLRYDIAEIYREQGDFRNALQMYTEVYGVDSTYRDVSSKLEEMKTRIR